MSEYVLLEEAISRQLDKIDGIKPRPYPDDPKDLGRTTVLAQIAYGYTRSTFTVIQEAQPPSHQLIMRETASVEFTIKLKGLRTHQGCLPYLADIKKLLLGFYPIKARGSEPLRPTAAGFKALDEGLWYYSLTCACSFLLFDGAEFGEYHPNDAPTLPKVFKLKTGIWCSANPEEFGENSSHLDTVLEFDKTDMGWENL